MRLTIDGVADLVLLKGKSCRNVKHEIAMPTTTLPAHVQISDLLLRGEMYHDRMSGMLLSELRGPAASR